MKVQVELRLNFFDFLIQIYMKNSLNNLKEEILSKAKAVLLEGTTCQEYQRGSKYLDFNQILQEAA
jgi:hypothetical protein